MDFNPKPSYVMHIDINSCFATIEQQANPYLRNKPIVVAAYATDRGCILASSIEAKKLGIKTGMRVCDGKRIYPNLVALPPDPSKYREVHLALRKIVSQYTNDFHPKSIDEFVLNMHHAASCACRRAVGIHQVALEIKKKIKEEIGDWITVSIGIGPSRFIAKTAAGLHKPDGLDEINKDNFWDVYSSLKLTDLCGINIRNEIRLKRVGINSVCEFYDAPLWRLRIAFKSVMARHWFLRLRGYEVDDIEFKRRSFGNSYALPKPTSLKELAPILTKLTEKMAFRLRKSSFRASGVHLSILFWGYSFWHKGYKVSRAIFDSREFYKEAYKILTLCSLKKPVRNLAVSCFDLVSDKSLQLNLFEDLSKKEMLTQAVDAVNKRFGNFVVTSARMINTKNLVPDRIAFGQYPLL